MKQTQKISGKKRNTRNSRTQKDEKKEKIRAFQPEYTDIFVIPRSTTLLETLNNRKKNMSRNSIKHLLSNHQVLVNGTVVTQFDYPLAKDDEVRIARSSVKTSYINHKKAERVQYVEPLPKSMILYEDDDFLAVDKPVGLLSVESDEERRSAYTMAAEYLRRKGAKSRPYLLHRIDKETSGVLVFAKDIKLQSMLRMHWNEDVRLREYYAVVTGTFEEKKGTLIDYLFENKNHMVLVSKQHNGKKAVTNYEVVKESKDFSLLRVTIDTGRKNQIRVQMTNAGHPLIGDDKYGEAPNPIKRLGLHASSLSFVHPETHKVVTFTSPVPQAFYELF